MAHEAKTAAAPTAPEAPKAVAEPSAGRKFKLIVGGLIAVITLAECCLGFIYLPSSHAAPAGELEELEADASDASEVHGGHGAHAAKADSKHKKSAKNRPPEASEMDLGEFRVTAFQPLSNTTVRIDFHLFGTVAHGQEESFTSLLEAKKQRVRDQVIATVRSADMADFTEPGLGLIKRRILETTNRTIGKPCLEAVLFSDFSFIEQ